MHHARVSIRIEGTVQGVGFRPFLFRLARELHLTGQVRNHPVGVLVEVQGPPEGIDAFLERIRTGAPPRAEPGSIECEPLPLQHEDGFTIAASEVSADGFTVPRPDLAPCPDCLAELLDPANRRHRHPFLACTQCGPRFSIQSSRTWDREGTSMAPFPMCPACAAEYRDPGDRRFHAQPIACPDCGPALNWENAAGGERRHDEAALLAAARALRDGAIVALKGVGGYQLLVDARDEDAVRRLRARKRRENKPFAVMVADLDHAGDLADPDHAEREALASPEAPVVLLRKTRRPSSLVPSVAPGLDSLGLLLPASPLHHLLARDLGFPLVATSGNRSGEPICLDGEEARERLGDIADGFLGHDREIVHRVDDSVVQVIEGRLQVLRPARGYAPRAFRLPRPIAPTLATGGHLKNTVSVATAETLVLGPHIGDLESPASRETHEEACRSLPECLGMTPRRRLRDLHPGFRTGRDRVEIPGTDPETPVEIQHHSAHLASCLLENQLAPPVLGVVWDGTGHGIDGTIWGGEFLLAETGPGGELAFRRLAHLRSFPLPGGEAAVREPRRCALGLCHEVFGDALFGDSPTPSAVERFSPGEARLLRRALARGTNAPVTSSAGRLFDAVASLLDLRQVSNYEGQAAIELEQLADPDVSATYSFDLGGPCPPATDGPAVVDWEPLLRDILEDLERGVPAAIIAGKFHATLAEITTALAVRSGIATVALSGGCFQNRLLTSRIVKRLRQEGLEPAWHRSIPPNDGGLSAGQLAAVAGPFAPSPDSDVEPGSSNRNLFPSLVSHVPRNPR